MNLPITVLTLCIISKFTLLYLTCPSILAGHTIQSTVINVSLAVGPFISSHTGTLVGVELVLKIDSEENIYQLPVFLTLVNPMEGLGSD